MAYTNGWDTSSYTTNADHISYADYQSLYAQQLQSTYATTTATSNQEMWAQWNTVGSTYSYIPPELEEQVEAIMGAPAGAKFLISYAFKKSKDPVIFLQDKKQMIGELIKLLKNKRVDKSTILIHQITKQFKPSKYLMKKYAKD